MERRPLVGTGQSQHWGTVLIDRRVMEVILLTIESDDAGYGRIPSICGQTHGMHKLLNTPNTTKKQLLEDMVNFSMISTTKLPQCSETLWECSRCNTLLYTVLLQAKSLYD